MNFNLIQWLFTDPCSATNCVVSTATSPGTPPETFHFYIPWTIFCIIGVLIPFYYSVEGRKRSLRILFRMACMALSVACQFTDMGDNMDRVSHTKIPQGAGQLSGI